MSSRPWGPYRVKEVGRWGWRPTRGETGPTSVTQGARGSPRPESVCRLSAQSPGRSPGPAVARPWVQPSHGPADGEPVPPQKFRYENPVPDGTVPAGDFVAARRLTWWA